MYSFETALLQMVRVGSPALPLLSPEEWQPVAQLARREHLTPLVYAAGRDAAGGGRDAAAAMPAETATALAEAYAASASASVELYRQLAGVGGALYAAGIPALLLKGAALARPVYQDAALRPFSDLDLLVHEADIDRVHLTLTGLGYDIGGGRPSDADRIWRHGRGYFDPTRRRVPVDVHWRYAGYPLLIPLDYDAVFARSPTFSVDGLPVGMPSAADMVVALSISFLRELWYGKPRLRYLRDIAEVCGRGRVEWARLSQVVDASPLLRTPLFLSVAGAAGLLGAPVPPETIALLRGRRGSIFRRRLLARVTGQIMRMDRPLAAVGQVGLMRGLDAGIVEMMAWLWRLLAVPRPLAPSQRRWLRYLGGGQFRGARPID
jgi:hypothetical protein